MGNGRKSKGRKDKFQMVAAGSRLNILGSSRSTGHSSTFTRHSELLMAEDPHGNTESSKTLQLSEQLEEKLNLLSSCNSKDQKRSDAKTAFSFKVLLKNNIFARRRWTQESGQSTPQLDAKKVDPLAKGRDKKQKVPKSNDEKIAEKIASMLGTSELGIIKMVIQLIGCKEAMKMCQLTLKSEDCLVNFENRTDTDSIQSPLDFFIVLVDLETNIPQEMKKKLMDRAKRIQVSGKRCNKKRCERKREKKLIKQKAKSIQNELNEISLKVGNETNQNSNELKPLNSLIRSLPTESMINKKTSFIICKPRLQIDNQFKISQPINLSDSKPFEKDLQSKTVFSTCSVSHSTSTAQADNLNLCDSKNDASNLLKSTGSLSAADLLK